eukprot:TRINITY_DN82293_c0_g1_i1.p1 TRINITY_DN82293_c0_g1~~TRINITY_DN82293_c0_g1_i1.p1  ORF type:complete len:145 (+),score=11.09 TRINITY_DN82293_c0_g1_i1:130-564(+)
MPVFRSRLAPCLEKDRTEAIALTDTLAEFACTARHGRAVGTVEWATGCLQSFGALLGCFVRSQGLLLKSSLSTPSAREDRGGLSPLGDSAPNRCPAPNEDCVERPGGAGPRFLLATTRAKEDRPPRRRRPMRAASRGHRRCDVE